MLKKLMILAAVLFIPMVLASAASAAPAQYPPGAGGGVAGGGTGGGGVGSGNVDGTTLARTGSNTGPLVLVGVALVSVGGIAVVTSRRFRHTD